MSSLSVISSNLLCPADGQPLLASGGSSGVISIWNLEKRRLHSVIREAHDGSIVSLHFFANEPVLMSSAADNSIKVSAVFLSSFFTSLVVTDKNCVSDGQKLCYLISC